MTFNFFLVSVSLVFKNVAFSRIGQNRLQNEIE